MVLNILSGIVLLFLMVFSSGIVVDIVEQYAVRLQVKRQNLTAVLMGFSLALPELFIGVAAAMVGKPEIALGNVVGANLANLSLIIGCAAVLAGTVSVVGEYLQRDLWVTLGLAMLPFLMLMDGRISGFEGFVLILLYLVYAIFISQGKGTVKFQKKKTEIYKSWPSIIILVLGLIILSTSSWLLVEVAMKIASAWEVSWYWVGLILIAFGTTLPELSLLSMGKKKAALVLPNLLGSVVMNSTLVVGVVTLLQPIMMQESFQRGLSGVFLVAILGLFWLFTKSKKKLEKWEGVVLIGVYLMFVGIQMIFA